ncbi:MAG: DUF1640 domain-containing protein [Magnetococcales bacterium]|nr:DUF1640 domain-containing protein [Magnetococcales bacterium]
MAHAVPFDTLAFVRELETSGVPSPQAEAQAKALSRVLQVVEESRFRELATRGDVLRLEKEVLRVEKGIESAKAETIKWTAGMFAAQTALILGAIFALMRMNQPHATPAPQQDSSVQEMRLPPQQAGSTPSSR